MCNLCCIISFSFYFGIFYPHAIFCFWDNSWNFARKNTFGQLSSQIFCTAWVCICVLTNQIITELVPQKWSREWCRKQSTTIYIYLCFIAFNFLWNIDKKKFAQKNGIRKRVVTKEMMKKPRLFHLKAFYLFAYNSIVGFFIFRFYSPFSAIPSYISVSVLNIDAVYAVLFMLTRSKNKHCFSLCVWFREFHLLHLRLHHVILYLFCFAQSKCIIRLHEF